MSNSDSKSSSSSSRPKTGPESIKMRKKLLQTPQMRIDEFWAKWKTKAPGKATSIIPQNEYAELAARRASAKRSAPAITTQKSYEDAVAQCRHKVEQIVRECRRVNQKYRDAHFDLEADLKLNRRDCLDSLDNDRSDHDGNGGKIRRPPTKDRLGEVKSTKYHQPETKIPSILSQIDGGGDTAKIGSGNSKGKPRFKPGAVKRVVDIYDDPHFFIDGPMADDVRQGRNGDCWLMAALCTLSNKPGLIEKCCVAHDTHVGVYGFVFHRDGEWFSEIIDDKLYLTKPDYDESFYERIMWEDRERINSEDQYRKIYQTNSGALYFAQCENPNETWLPLLEKAYAKAHGDYSAIEGGYGGEGIEDLTGGVTSEIYTTDILDKEHFWKEELMKVNQDFLFGCSTGVWGRCWGERKGIVELHAYSVLKAREIDGNRLVLLKNPWGKHEWKGAWSDGSKEWTADWLQKLDHKFGDDGSFWISYEDLLKKYQAFDRTRLFGPEWKVASIWTTMDVSWTLDYHDTKFVFTLARPGPVVIVLSQLDERYFKGLQGQYRFELSFRVHHRANKNNKTASSTDEYVVRSQSYYRMNRSVNVELDLDAGEYVVVAKIDAQRYENVMPIEDVVRAYSKSRREKLMRIGLAYDLAHSKGKIIETPEEKEMREAYETRKRERERRRVAKVLREEKVAERQARAERRTREKKRREKLAAKSEKRMAKKQAKIEAKLTAENEKTEAEKAEAEKAVDEKVEDKKAEGLQTGDAGEKEISFNPDAKETATQTPTTTDEKQVKIETAREAGGTTVSSTEPGENTPTSSTASGKTPAAGEDAPEEEEYATAAEEEPTSISIEQPQRDEESPSTPKPSPKPPPESTLKDNEVSSNSPERVDVGVQTGPGLPLSPYPSHPRYAPHMQLRPPPAGGMPPHIMYPELAQVPPNLRSAYLAAAERRNMRVEVTSVACSSDSPSIVDGISEDDSSSTVSSISERDIDARIAQNRALEAARANNLAAAAKVSRPGQSGQPGQHGGPLAEKMDEFEKDPWNAVGVFGLRVYHKGQGDRDDGVVLRVERPNILLWTESEDNDENGGGKEGEEGGEEESRVLDVDDSAKDAVGQEAVGDGEVKKSDASETSDKTEVTVRGEDAAAGSGDEKKGEGEAVAERASATTVELKEHGKEGEEEAIGQQESDEIYVETKGDQPLVTGSKNEDESKIEEPGPVKPAATEIKPEEGTQA